MVTDSAITDRLAAVEGRCDGFDLALLLMLKIGRVQAVFWAMIGFLLGVIVCLTALLLWVA